MKQTNNNLKDLLGYLVVGGLATVVEWLIFWLFCEKLAVQYMIATSIAYIFSTFANWAFGRLLVFKTVRFHSVLKEIASIYLTSILGLLLNLLIMFVMVQLIGVTEMISKIAATILVFAYNYIVRKKLIYR